MKLSELKVREFLEELASPDPSPGGGAAAAFSVALGASIAQMVAGLTARGEKYMEHKCEMEDIVGCASSIRERLLQLMEEDALAYATFMEALKLPKETVEEMDIREIMKEKAMQTAIQVPMDVLKECRELAVCNRALLERGNNNASADAAVAARLTETAAAAEVNNILINLSRIDDSDYARQVKYDMEALHQEIREICSVTEAIVDRRVSTPKERKGS